MAPTLSVILPAFNSEKFIAEAIESILAQSFSDYELLIADDGSTDRTRSIIDGYNHTRIYQFHNQTNLGKVQTVNSLLARCRGKYLTIHDSDDVSDRERFASQIVALEQDEDLVMVGCGFRYVDKRGQLIKEVNPLSDYIEIKEKIQQSSQFHGPTMIMRREYLGQKIYREYFKDYNEDYDLSYRLVQLGKCYNLPEPMMNYRVVPNSLSKTLTPLKRSYSEVVKTLGTQRELYGLDDLDRNDLTRIKRIESEVTRRYDEDSALIYRENANLLCYFNQYWDSLPHILKAVKINPFELRHYKMLAYSLLKSVTK